MGLLAEILMRTYHESQDKRIYILDPNAEEQDETATADVSPTSLKV
jgi:hypothetical protein